ncbi:hypothetical protein NL676_007117 [Syzygium grande]|nr:hypothetical protein NL676_007117 [Syzygium grande]
MVSILPWPGCPVSSVIMWRRSPAETWRSAPPVLGPRLGRLRLDCQIIVMPRRRGGEVDVNRAAAVGSALTVASACHHAVVA